MERTSSSPMSTKKMYFLATLGLCIPIFLVSMAYLAVKSDEKNKQKYAQQQAEIIKRIQEKKVAEQENRLVQPNVETTH